MGMFRVLKFAKYLPHFGWEPVVLTVGNASCNKLDWTGLAEVQDISVVRTYQLEPSIRRVFKGKKDFEEALSYLWQEGKDRHGESLAKKWKNWIIHNLLIPDANVGWLPFGVWRAVEICKTEKIDVLFSTAPPLTASVIGLVTRRITGVPWITDFRDPWSLAPQFNPYAGAFKKAADRWVENQIYNHADRCIFVYEDQIRETVRKFSGLSADRCVLIPNGFDSEDFDYSIPVDSSCLRITYAGRLALDRSLDFFLKCIAEVLEAMPELQDILKLEFAGEIDRHNRRLLSEFKFPQTIHMHGILPVKSCNKLLCSSSLLLAIVGSDENRYGSTSSKILNYIGSGRPILLVSPPGEAAAFVTGNKLGFHLNTQDPSAAKRLREVLESGFYSFVPNDTLRKSYNRKVHTGKLARELDALVERT